MLPLWLKFLAKQKLIYQKQEIGILNGDLENRW